MLSNSARCKNFLETQGIPTKSLLFELMLSAISKHSLITNIKSLRVIMMWSSISYWDSWSSTTTVFDRTQPEVVHSATFYPLWYVGTMSLLSDDIIYYITSVANFYARDFLASLQYYLFTLFELKKLYTSYIQKNTVISILDNVIEHQMLFSWSRLRCVMPQSELDRVELRIDCFRSELISPVMYN